MVFGEFVVVEIIKRIGNYLKPLDRSFVLFRKGLKSPVFLILIGSILALTFLKLTFSLPYYDLYILVAIGSLTYSILLLKAGDVSSFFGLILLGWSVFLLYGTLIYSHHQTQRNWLNNRRVHVRGEFIPPNQFNVKSINGEGLPVKLFLYGFDSPGKARYQSTAPRELSVTGTVKWTSLDGEFQNYLTQNNYHGVLEPVKIHSVDRHEGGVNWIPSSWRGPFRRFFKDRARLAPYSIKFLQAIIMGQRTFPEHLDLIFRRLGIVHLFVISGLHVGTLFYLLSWGLQFLSRKLRFVLVGILLSVYLSFIGWPISATRAGLLIAVGGIADLLDRTTTHWDILFTTIFILIIWSPFIVFNVGFQLSIAAVVGIFLVYPQVTQRESFVFVRYLWINAGAFLATLPVILYHFSYLAPFGIMGSFLGGLIFPLLMGVLVFQMIFLVSEWDTIAFVIEKSLGDGIDFLLEVLSTQVFVLGVSSVTWFSLGIVSILAFFFLFNRYNLWFRLGAGILLICFLTVMVRVGVEPRLDVRVVRGIPITYFRTSDQHNGVILPPGSRINNYQVDGIGRFLKENGVYHVDYLISDYNNRLFSQFDPDFSVRQFLPYWSGETVQWRSGGFYSEGMTLKTALTDIHFGPENSNTIDYQPQGMFARTADNRCLINDVSFLGRGSFDRLEKKSCRMIFLRDNPITYRRGEDPVRGKGRLKNNSILSVIRRYFYNGI